MTRMQDDQYRETLRVVGSALHPQLIFYSVRDRLVFFFQLLRVSIGELSGATRGALSRLLFFSTFI
jgi:hypothetical protein